MAVLLGLNLLKDNSLRAGYSFDYVIQNRDAKQATSHEIMVSYALPVGVYGEKKIIRTPRFRQETKWPLSSTLDFSLTDVQSDARLPSRNAWNVFGFLYWGLKAYFPSRIPK